MINKLKKLFTKNIENTIHFVSTTDRSKHNEFHVIKIEPRHKDDAHQIAIKIKEEKSVIIGLSHLTEDEKEAVTTFLSGVAFGVNARFESISHDEQTWQSFPKGQKVATHLFDK